MNKRTSFYVVVVLVAAFGVFLLTPLSKNDAPAASSTATQTQSISYQGVDGKNALELLKAAHQVETKSSSFGEFVESIDGVKADTTHFWAFLVNGQMAEVGAGSYQTKNGESITWQLQAL